MIEDIIAQNHTLVDILTYDEGCIANSVLHTISDTRSQGGAFAQLTGINIDVLKEGRCRGSLDVKHHHLNPVGIAHGGVAYTLGDHICGVAASTMVHDDEGLVTQDMHIRFHRPARPGVMRAAARVLHMGQRVITVQGRVSQGDQLVASISATYALLTPEEMRGE